MLYLLLIFVFLFLISNGFVFLEEEVLVILLGFSWLYFFGDLLYNLIVEELEGRGDYIKSRFIWYMSCKENLLQLMVQLHQERLAVYREVVSIIHNYYFKCLESFLGAYLYQMRGFSVYNRVEDLETRLVLLSSAYVLDIYRTPFSRVSLD